MPRTTCDADSQPDSRQAHVTLAPLPPNPSDEARIVAAINWLIDWLLEDAKAEESTDDNNRAG